MPIITTSTQEMNMTTKELADRLNAIPHKYVAKVQYAHKPHAIIEYARRHYDWMTLDLSKYYQECRNKARSPNYTFCGD
jgi:hypothetical protein